MVLALAAVYIYWISYLVEEGDIKEPLIAVAVLFAGLVWVLIATLAVYFM